MPHKGLDPNIEDFVTAEQARLLHRGIQRWEAGDLSGTELRKFDDLLVRVSNSLLRKSEQPDANPSVAKAKRRVDGLNALVRERVDPSPFTPDVGPPGQVEAPAPEPHVELAPGVFLRPDGGVFFREEAPDEVPLSGEVSVLRNGTILAGEEVLEGGQARAFLRGAFETLRRQDVAREEAAGQPASPQPGGGSALASGPPPLDEGGDIAPIGVPKGFVAQTRRTQTGIPGPDEVEVEETPRYFAGRDDLLPNSWSQARVAEVQDRLADAGLLVGPYTRGLWNDPRTGGADQAAWNALLGFSNMRGMNWKESLLLLETDTDQAMQLAGFTPQPFVRPDPAALAQTVKTEISNLLRRDPTDEELAELSDELLGIERQAHGSQVAAARAEFAAQTGAAPGTVEEVDPVARFRELLEEEFTPEIEHVERVEEFAGERSNLLDSLNRVNRLIGGG